MTELLWLCKRPTSASGYPSCKKWTGLFGGGWFLALDPSSWEELGPAPLCRGAADSSSPESCGAWVEQWSIKRLIAIAALDWGSSITGDICWMFLQGVSVGLRKCHSYTFVCFPHPFVLAEVHRHLSVLSPKSVVWFYSGKMQKPFEIELI